MLNRNGFVQLNELYTRTQLGDAFDISQATLRKYFDKGHEPKHASMTNHINHVIETLLQGDRTHEG